MFSPRVVAVLALCLAAASAFPADKPQDKPVVRPITTIVDDIDDGSWLGVSLFGNLFAPLWRLFPTFNDIGPKIITDNDKFQVVINVKSFKKEDLKVKVKGTFLFIQGSHSTSQDDHDLFASQFFHTYTLPTNASGADLKAELSTDGYLVITAPMSGAKSTDGEREVPIVESGAPYKEASPDAPATTPAAAVNSSQDDRKEETTPSVTAPEVTTPATEKDATEKDNDIPHGNEVISP